MAKNKDKKEVKNADKMYKGYNLNFLRQNPDHPDYHLVKEAEQAKKR